MFRVHRKEIYLVISEYVLEAQGTLGDFFKNKRASGSHFLPLLPILDTKTRAGISAVPTHFTYLANGAPCPCMLLWICPIQPGQTQQEISWMAVAPLLQWTSTEFASTVLSPLDLPPPICP